MQPTAPISPTLKRFTSPPTAVTRPTISCPGTAGYVVPLHSLRTVCKSEWHTPQYRISSCTSCGSGSRRAKENGASGALADVAAYPTVLVLAGTAATSVVDIILISYWIADELCCRFLNVKTTSAKA